MNSLWDREDFEDHLTKGILSLYEKVPKKFKILKPLNKVSDGELNRIRNFGLYFGPADRIAMDSMVIDPPQKQACFTFTEDKEVHFEEPHDFDEKLRGYVSHW